MFRIFYLLGLVWANYKPMQNCTLENAEIAEVSGEKYCFAKIGYTNQSEAADLCRSLNASLPISRNPEEKTEIQWIILKSVGYKISGIPWRMALDVRKINDVWVDGQGPGLKDC